MSRDMRSIIRGAGRGRTITFPKTIRRVEAGAFYGNLRTRSVVLNEGMERLGEDTDGTGQIRGPRGAFDGSRIARVTLPSTLKALGDCAFYGRKELTRVELPLCLERIG